MIIIDNALNIAEKRQIASPSIEINLGIEKDNYVVVSIKDNAGGIAKKPIERIFDPYEQTSSESGLGLSIVKTIVELRLNGTMEAKNVNNGAVFLIKFPLN